MNTFEQNNSNNDPLNSKIGAIRDIIFGQNLDALNQDITDIRQLISRHRNDLDGNLQLLKEQMMMAIQNLEREVERKIESIEEATLTEINRLEQGHISKNEFGNLLNDLGKNLK